MQDLEALGARLPDANALFRRDHEPARRAAYAIMAEAWKAHTGPEKIVVLLALESTGHVFFTETSQYVKRVGCQGLRYFSEDHLLVEQGHAVFEERAKQLLDRVVLDAVEQRRAVAIVDACYDAVEAMFDQILRAIAGEKAANHTARSVPRLEAATAAG